jgi:hypothetical protein
MVVSMERRSVCELLRSVVHLLAGDPDPLRLGLLLRPLLRQLPDQLRVPVVLRDAHAGNPEPYTLNPEP